ncbi:ABC-type uncharacterized transport system substrate-binding protein [Paucibacter oligotrophus]|uniref:ABC-type uncharacterized transport system substrate-binding protein n=1 Tax=Roseateles oligotrophus TaxID=1769250 RepID=A0A840L586_9BURK|nr:ABC transporter substrate binding protein [Roseateles oligotrophus]MBB4841842.1 ABC-type uncharacterized transport system substrate-binding protein [Roseateles oligotrophus]
MARLFVQLLCVVSLALGLRAASSVPAQEIRIAYFGSWPLGTDSTYRTLAQALLRPPQQQGPNLRLDHYLVKLDEAGSVEAQVGLARARGTRVLVAPTTGLALAVSHWQGQTPLVFASHPDPVQWNLVSSGLTQALPITGVTQADVLHGKRLELLCEAFPGLRRIAVLGEKRWLPVEGQEILHLARQGFGLQAELLTPGTVEELDALMRSPQARRFDAWYFPPTYLAYVAEKQIIAHLKRLNKPSIHITVAEVQAGAAMAYAQDGAFVIPAMAELVHRILNGEDAASIPVERPRRIVLAVRADAQFGGQRINPAVVRKADLVF